MQGPNVNGFASQWNIGLKLRITDLPLSTNEIMEVSVFFTDGWQH